MSNELVKQDGFFLAPVVSVEAALDRYKTFGSLVSQILKEGIDYGPIPGAGKKKNLLKPGAEKMAAFYGLTVEFEMIEKIEDWTGAEHHGEPFFNYHYRCKVSSGSRLVATGEASCNSWEKKYRYRKAVRRCPECGAETIARSKYPPREDPQGPPGWYCNKNRGGCGQKFGAYSSEIVDQEAGTIKNPDVADQVNTLQKMSQKRAFIAAVLVATNASEYFTQDMEELAAQGSDSGGTIEADFEEMKDEDKGAPVLTLKEQRKSTLQALADLTGTNEAKADEILKAVAGQEYSISYLRKCKSLEVLKNIQKLVEEFDPEAQEDDPGQPETKAEDDSKVEEGGEKDNAGSATLTKQDKADLKELKLLLDAQAPKDPAKQDALISEAMGEPLTIDDVEALGGVGVYLAAVKAHIGKKKKK